MAIATDPQSLITAANQNQDISDVSLALQVQIYLLQQLTGNTMTAQQLITAASPNQLISDSLLAQQIIVYLLGQNTTNGGGTAGIGNPTGTATVGTTYLDTSTNNFWAYGSTGWVKLLSS